jgi:hypothetical protein
VVFPDPAAPQITNTRPCLVIVLRQVGINLV